MDGPRVRVSPTEQVESLAGPASLLRLNPRVLSLGLTTRFWRTFSLTLSNFFIGAPNYWFRPNKSSFPLAAPPQWFVLSTVDRRRYIPRDCLGRPTGAPRPDAPDPREARTEPPAADALLEALGSTEGRLGRARVRPSPAVRPTRLHVEGPGSEATPPPAPERRPPREVGRRGGAPTLNGPSTLKWSGRKWVPDAPDTFLPSWAEGLGGNVSASHRPLHGLCVCDVALWLGTDSHVKHALPRIGTKGTPLVEKVWGLTLC